MILYGKQQLKSRLDTIAESGRLSHAIMFYGDNGAGRLTMAHYTAQLFLCEAPQNGSPCGSCYHCRHIEAGTHPDIIYPRRLGEGKYTADKKQPNNIREIMDSVVIKPNSAPVKLYIFEECDEMSPIVQNTLLKAIEEPSDFVRFIFICENPENILETIRSRVTDFEVPTPPAEECARCLTDNGACDAAKAAELASLMGGNIGRCMESLSGEGDTSFIETAARIAEGIAKRSTYNTAAALCEHTGRAEFLRVLFWLAEMLQEALVLNVEADSNKKSGTAAEIAATRTTAQLLGMLDAVIAATENMSLNLNVALSASWLAAKLN